jgi:hypothetical protein
MRRRAAGILLLLGVALGLRNDAMHTENRRKRDLKTVHVGRGRPEPELFLMLAAEVMERYHDSHGRYPGVWQGLNIKFGMGGYNSSDPGLRPRPDQDDDWRPLGCRFTYVIRDARKNSFLIQAVDDAGGVAYELEQGMKRPRRAGPLAPLFQWCAPPCDGYDQGDEKARRFGKDPSLSLSSSFEVVGGELVLRYRVENRGTRDAYLFTGVRYSNGIYDADPDMIYVHLEQATKTVWLNKRIPVIPEGFNPYSPACPEQTPVRAGETFREEVHVPLPIQEDRAYGERSGEPVVVPYEAVRFTLQYYWRTEGMTEEIKHISRFPMDEQPADKLTLIRTRGGAPLTESDHGFLESERIPLRVKVLEVP